MTAGDAALPQVVLPHVTTWTRLANGALIAMTDNPANAPENAARAQANRRSRWFARGLIATTAILSLGLFCMCGVAMYGMVGGEEFSPDTFAQRSFYFYEIPLVELQVTPVYRQDHKSDLVSHLRSKQLLPPSERDEPRWHFVRAVRGGQASSGDAAILCRYFDIRQDDECLWLEWTKDHSEAAAILWPAIAAIARQHQYILVPDILELAATSDTASFGRELDQLLDRRYRELAATHFAVEAYDKAIENYTRALEHDPHDGDALTGRADAHQAAGQLEQAMADRKRAAQLTP